MAINIIDCILYCILASKWSSKFWMNASKWTTNINICLVMLGFSLVSFMALAFVLLFLLQMRQQQWWEPLPLLWLSRFLMSTRITSFWRGSHPVLTEPHLWMATMWKSENGSIKSEWHSCIPPKCVNSSSYSVFTHGSIVRILCWSYTKASQ